MIIEDINSKSPFAELKSSDGNNAFRIHVYSYQYPELTESHDADWYMNYISLNINGSTTEIDKPIIEGRVLESLLEDIIKFKDLSIDFVYASFTEPEFEFTLSNESLSNKDILVRGEMVIKKDNKRKVTVPFQFKTDIASIEKFIVGIKQILIKFPPRC